MSEQTIDGVDIEGEQFYFEIMFGRGMEDVSGYTTETCHNVAFEAMSPFGLKGLLSVLVSE